jgi:CheY-like chemotaxis protein
MVSLSLDWVDGVLRCEVADTGCGFAPEDKERLFAAFEQVSDPAGPHPEGAGLGLPICRGLLGAMGGAIDADSIPGDGARFWLTAPCPAVAAQARQPDTVVQPGADILVVEDSPEIQQLMTAVLGSAGHRIEIACNGREGADALRRRSFDLCLMDLRMPVMGGDEAVKMIRTDPDVRVRATPVVMVSAEAEPGDQGRFRAIGFDDALGKPLDIARLLGAVEAWRGRSSEAMDVKAKAS